MTAWYEIDPKYVRAGDRVQVTAVLGPKALVTVTPYSSGPPEHIVERLTVDHVTEVQVVAHRPATPLELEPTGLSAVVRRADRSLVVRRLSDTDERWVSPHDDGGWFTWDELQASQAPPVDVLFEGVAP